jgi:dolichyl-phosphate-mannose--protein O-mannosyl transferase
VFLVDIVKIVGMIVVVVVDFMVDFVLLFDEIELLTDVVFDGITVE